MSHRPIGYFVHHQGRGHAVRAAAVANALPADRPVSIFCARDDIFPNLRDGVEVISIPSLFEPQGDEPTTMDWIGTPDTLHCAPLGWRSISSAMARMAAWFSENHPVLMISDVSAEVAQLARLCSVPHIKVLQHGDRSDTGHQAAYDGAVGILAPFHSGLAQPDWSASMREKMHFAAGLGASMEDMPSRQDARDRLGFNGERPIALVISGGGGSGVTQAPLGVAARTYPEMDWVAIGHVQKDWHATEPANLRHMGWVNNAPDWIAAADLVIASTGNTTCQQILTAGRPWIAVPEWRYFDEQVRKAEALQSAGAALHLPHLPSSADAWRRAVTRCRNSHDPNRQAALVSSAPDEEAAAWLEDLIARIWPDEAELRDRRESSMSNVTVSALTIARGRAKHLANVIRGLAAQTTPPDEFIIAVMQDDLYDDLPDVPFPIRQIRVKGEELPLAAARNAAAEAASGDLLIFLDVDCIPNPDLVADYVSVTADGGLVMGEVMYLPDGVSDPIDFERFDRVAVRHSDRRGPPEAGLARCEDYRCFWSLNFAMRRADWNAAGGFDIAFTGYGGEDTDFGRTLSERGIPIWWAKGARVYHQYHPHAMPPLHHMASVLRNAEVFASKWGHRTMEHWLHAFRLMGLIENADGKLRIVRQPDERDYALCRQQSHQPYANTRRVLDHLQGIYGDGRDSEARRIEVERAQSELLNVAAE